MANARNSHLRDCVIEFFHPEKDPIVLGDCIRIGVNTQQLWQNVDQSKFLHYLVLYSRGPSLAMKVHEVIGRILAGKGDTVDSLCKLS